MNILITGGEGFLGKHLQSILKAGDYCSVQTFRSCECDLRDGERTRRYFEESQPETVFHLAATVGGIGANQRSPATFWRDNLLMGINVFEACRSVKVNRLILVGTTCSYPKFPKTFPFSESDLFDGYPEETNAPYGIAKRCLIAGAEAYRNEFGLSTITAIPTNMYGPGDNFDLESSHVIPALIRKMHAAKEGGLDSIELWGTGKASRDFIYVSDVARALVLMMETREDPAPINLGTGKEIRIETIAKTIAQVVGFTGEIKWDTKRPDGQPRRALDNSRALQMGWKPLVPLEQGLKNTYQYFRSL